jgi:two-component system LytT family response regulator
MDGIEGKIIIPTNEGYQFLNAAEINYLQADNVYSVFYLVDGSTVVSSKNIGYYEPLLPAKMFFRIHHSHIVNLSKIRKFIRGTDAYIILDNKKALKVSRSYKDRLLNLFKSGVCIRSRMEQKELIEQNNKDS